MEIFRFGCVRMIALLFLAALGACRDKNNYSDVRLPNQEGTDETTRLKTENDADFVQAAADDGMLQIQLGRLAQVNGQSSKSKALGRTTLAAHNKANEELRKIAGRKNIMLPAALRETSQQRFIELALLHEDAFDDAYVKFLLENHAANIQTFKEEVTNGNDEEVKTWARSKIQLLQRNLLIANQATTRQPPHQKY